jgi:hypothetical protein
MTLTTAEQVRLRIQDIPRWFDLTLAGNGTAAVFDLPQTNITSASAFVPLGGTAWTATGCTIEAGGVVMFSGVISAQSAWRVRGMYSTFSDAEIGYFSAHGGSVAGAAREAVNVLLFDAIKRARWAAPDGTTYDDTAALSFLLALHEKLNAELSEMDIASGGFASWAEGQAQW